MRWGVIIVAVSLVGLLTGCGAGTSNEFGSATLTPPNLSSTVSVVLADSVLVSVTTDYFEADRWIRFIQIDGDEDFDPLITAINQGFAFSFQLPKGYRYTIWFVDIPSIDAPAPFEIDLRGSATTTLDIKLTFPIHP